MTLDQLIAKFLAPPLYSRHADSTTAYTAIYRPTEGRVDYLWPGRASSQRFDQFTIGEYIHDYGDLSL
jgi:predicted choloylglycine hydrolase